MENKKHKVLFYGTPGFAVESLKLLLENDINIIGVVTAPDRKAGRGQSIRMSEIKQFAITNNLPVFQPTNLKSPEYIAKLEELNPDLQIVIAFRMLPEVVWNYPAMGTYNVHASLLPDYRGAAPINWALYNGAEETGVTTFKLCHEIDTGDIAIQYKCKIDINDNFETLHNKLAALGASSILETVNKLFSDTLVLQKQKEMESIHPAPKIAKDHLELDLSKNRQKIYNHIRAFSPYPGARIRINGKSIKILNAEITDFGIPKSSNILFIHENKLFLKCLDTSLEVKIAQFEGKKAMNAKEIINGRLVN